MALPEQTGENLELELTAGGAIAMVLFKCEKATDSEAIAKMCERIGFFIDSNCPGHVVFDFEPVKFFSSEMLGLLLDIRTKLSAWNGEAVVSSLTPQLQRVFKVTNLDRVFRFYPDVETAVTAVNNVRGEK
jgi:anti-anti-sigma factor